MRDYKPIPVSAARQIAEKYDKNIVVIMAFERVRYLEPPSNAGGES